jgi:hypothetical protein
MTQRLNNIHKENFVEFLEATQKGMEKCVTTNRTYLEGEYVVFYFSDKRMHISLLETKHLVILSQSIQTV